MNDRWSVFKANLRFWLWRARTVNARRYVALLTIALTVGGLAFYSYRNPSKFIKQAQAANGVVQTVNSPTDNTVVVTGLSSWDQYFVDPTGLVHPYTESTYAVVSNIRSTNGGVTTDRVIIDANTHLTVDGATLYMAGKNGSTITLKDLTIKNNGILSPLSANRTGDNTLYNRSTCFAFQMTGFIKLTSPTYSDPSRYNSRYHLYIDAADDAATVETVPGYDGTSSIDGLSWTQGAGRRGGNASADWWNSNNNQNDSIAADFQVASGATQIFPVRISYYQYNGPGELRLRMARSQYDKNNGNSSNYTYYNQLTGANKMDTGWFYAPGPDGKITNTPDTMRLDLAYMPDSTPNNGSACYVNHSLLNAGDVYRFHNVNISGDANLNGSPRAGGAPLAGFGQEAGYFGSNGVDPHSFSFGWNLDNNYGTVWTRSNVSTSPLSTAMENNYPTTGWTSDYKSTIRNNALLIDQASNGNGGGRLVIQTSGPIVVNLGSSINATGTGYPGGSVWYDGNHDFGDSGWGPLGKTSPDQLAWTQDAYTAGGGAWSNGSGGGGGGGGKGGSCASCDPLTGGGGGGTMGAGGVGNRLPAYTFANGHWAGGGGAGYQGGGSSATQPGLSNRMAYTHGTGANLGGGGGVGGEKNAMYNHIGLGGSGGGKIDIRSGTDFTINGIVSADGQSPPAGEGGGGGGTVFLRASGALTIGSSAAVWARGGTPYGYSDTGTGLYTTFYSPSTDNVTVSGGGGGLIDIEAATFSFTPTLPDFCANPNLLNQGKMGMLDASAGAVDSAGHHTSGSEDGIISIAYPGTTYCNGGATPSDLQISKQIQQWNSGVTWSSDPTQWHGQATTTANWTNVVTTVVGNRIRVVISVFNPTANDRTGVTVTDTLPVANMVLDNGKAAVLWGATDKGDITPTVSGQTVTISNQTIPTNTVVQFIFTTQVTSPN